jgi:YVTN family beta-propeller protein
MKRMRASNAWALLILLCGWTNWAADGSVAGTEQAVLSHQSVLPGGSGPKWQTYVSPSALAATRDGKRLFIACATANTVATFDTASAKVTHSLKVDSCPLGLALSKDGSRLYVACAGPASTICVIDVATDRPRVIQRIPAGHTAMAPVLSPDGKTLYVCNRFDNDVSIIDLATGRELKRVRVDREPVSAALTPDGSLLLVANHLQAESANKLHIGAQVSVIDTRSLSLRKNISLRLGASLLRGVAISPDGRFAAVTHLRAMYWLSTTSVELGRMNGNALTVIDLEKLDVLGMVFLDQTACGAANPWDVAWTPDGQTIVVAHAGAHSVSLVDAPLCADRRCFAPAVLSAYETMDWPATPLPEQRPVRVRQRIALPGNGPRALALAGSQLYVANYFSDNLCRIDLAPSFPKAESLPLGQVPEPDAARKGEMLFNDGQLCFQGWQSCASCHDADARTDALNWDLLNDGIVNPKNTRSLVWAHRIGPAMALGVRTNAATAVRAGLRHILFTETGEDVPAAVDAYLQSLQPMASPRLSKGRLSPAARRGEQLFLSTRTGCVNCHPPPYFTDMAGHEVGTATVYHSMYQTQGADKASDRFYSPALVELWRTAPYLHDGSAVTLRDVLTTCNPNDRHGHTANFAPQEIDDLVEYLLSL